MFDATLVPSRWLAAWIVSWALVLLITPWFSGLSRWLCLGIDLAVVAWTVLALRRHWWVGERQLSWREGCWTLVQNGEPVAVQLDGEFYLSLWLIVLVFRRADGKKTPIVMTPDSVDPNTMRRLRILLKQLPVLVNT